MRQLVEPSNRKASYVPLRNGRPSKPEHSESVRKDRTAILSNRRCLRIAANAQPPVLQLHSLCTAPAPHFGVQNKIFAFNPHLPPIYSFHLFCCILLHISPHRSWSIRNHTYIDIYIYIYDPLQHLPVAKSVGRLFPVA